MKRVPSRRQRPTVRYTARVVEYLSPDVPRAIEGARLLSHRRRLHESVATFQDGEGTGIVQLDLPYGFLGYLDVNSSAMHTRSCLGRPIYRDTEDRDLGAKF